MGVTISFYSTAFLVIFISLNSVYVRSASVRKNATDLDSGKVIVKGNYNAVNLYRDRDVKTALNEVQKKLESLEGRLHALEKPGMRTRVSAEPQKTG